MNMTTKKGNPVTEDMLNAWADTFESGEWPEGKTAFVGRPRLSIEEVKQVTFRLPVSKIAAIDKVANEHGETRSEALRNAIDKYLLSA